MISVLQSLNGAQVLNGTCVTALSGCFSFFGTGGLGKTLATIVFVTVLFSVN